MLTLSPSAGGLSCGMAPVRAAAGHRPPAFAPGPLITRWRVGHLARQSRAAAAGAAQPTVETDVVVIGAGVGGLSCAGILAKHGLQVTVCESHTIAGGAAHAWVREGYHFEAGPSLYSGMAQRGKEANPLAHVLQAIGEPLELLRYNQWDVMLPEGTFRTEVGAAQFCEVLQQVRGPEAVDEWRRLQEHMRPLSRAASVLPPVALRFDLGVLLTGIARYLPSLLADGRNAARLTGPFSKVLDELPVRDPFIRNYLDLLSFMLSGLPADGTIAAEVAFMFNEWYRPDCYLEFPRGGSQAMIDALVRGFTKRGGQLMLGAHVERVLVEEKRAVGVQLRNGTVIRARKAVVANCTLWDLRKLLPPGAAPGLDEQAEELPVCRSFMHLHLGFDATGLENLLMHHIIVNSWEHGVDAEQNVVLVSIASVADPSLAPEGKHTLHAYYPATEPYEPWSHLRRGTPEYEQYKHERAAALWAAVERVIPDIRQRVEVEMVGTPLTHQRFLRRHKGSYGPALKAGQGTLPGPQTSVRGLLCCGDSTFPGIGLPAVAASGTIAANMLVPVGKHLELLEELGI